MSEDDREYPTVKPGGTVTIEVTDIDGKVYRTKCQIVDSAAPHKAECGYCRDCEWWDVELNNVRRDRWSDCTHFSASLMPPPGALLHVINAKRNCASVLTADVFGCVQFEARDG